MGNLTPANYLTLHIPTYQYTILPHSVVFDIQLHQLINTKNQHI